MMTREEHDQIFREGVKPFRDAAIGMGLDIELFDARIMAKKIVSDLFLEEARDFYRRKGDMPCPE